MSRPVRSPRGEKGWLPPSDPSTYRDLLLFEERLKTNAARLKKRKRRYQFFLLVLVFTIFVLASDVLLSTSLLIWPVNRLLPYSPVGPHDIIFLPAYVTQTALLVAVTTMLLFYASGLYAEKIGYANRYVPHANRALRAFNMYLNVRVPAPSISRPFTYFFSSTPISPTSSPASSPRGKSSTGRRSATPINPIPPSSNPRGELIFTSRVDKNFRESYERYRAAFERKRDEKVLADAAAAASARVWSWLPGARSAKAPLTRKESERAVLQQQVGEKGGRTTPSSSRSTTPVGGSPSSRRSPRRVPFTGSRTESSARLRSGLTPPPLMASSPIAEEKSSSASGRIDGESDYDVFTEKLGRDDGGLAGSDSQSSMIP